MQNLRDNRTNGLQTFKGYRTDVQAAVGHLLLSRLRTIGVLLLAAILE